MRRSPLALTPLLLAGLLTDPFGTPGRLARPWSPRPPRTGDYYTGLRQQMQDNAFIAARHNYMFDRSFAGQRRARRRAMTQHRRRHHAAR